MDRKTHTTSPYSAEFRKRAVQMVEDHLEGHRSRSAAMRDIAQKLGCSSDSLRVWYKQALRDVGKEAEPTRAEQIRIKELEREVRELRQARLCGCPLPTASQCVTVMRVKPSWKERASMSEATCRDMTFLPTRSLHLTLHDLRVFIV